jgi:hypothetical protein
MPHSSGPDWYARELAQLQDEMAQLHRLLEVITPIGEPHEETTGPHDGAPGVFPIFRSGFEQRSMGSGHLFQ